MTRWVGYLVGLRVACSLHRTIAGMETAWTHSPVHLAKLGYERLELSGPMRAQTFLGYSVVVGYHSALMMYHYFRML
ncbi:hypothetical protein ACKS0A_09561 [Histoplasma ohiense]